MKHPSQDPRKTMPRHSGRIGRGIAAAFRQVHGSGSDVFVEYMPGEYERIKVYSAHIFYGGT